MSRKKTTTTAPKRNDHDIGAEDEHLEPTSPHTLPELMKPVGGGYMPLYCAAQWIATEGGAVKFDPTERARWRAAYKQLLLRISSDEVTVSGIRNGDCEKIKGLVFASCKVSYPFEQTPLNLIFSEETYLVSKAYVGDEYWDCVNDRLATRSGTKWSKLMVLKSDVARCWSFAPASRERGRPSSMKLVWDEYCARRGRGELAGKGNGIIAKELSAWLREAHPNDPQARPKTIRLDLGKRVAAAAGNK